MKNIPVVPGRLDPPAEGEKKEFVLDGKRQCKHLTSTPSLIQEITAEQLKIHRQDCKNNRILKHSAQWRVKGLRVTRADRNWVGEKWKEWCGEIWWL